MVCKSYRMLFFCIFAAILTTYAQTGNPPQKNIAVSDLVGQGVDQSSVSIISDRLRTELFNTGAFKVLERQAMQDILKEQGFQQTGCTSDQCIVEIGQLLGVSHMVSGTVGKIGAMFTINVRMIDIKTGEIVYTTSVDCRCAIEDMLTSSVPSIAGKIAGNVVKPVPIVSKTQPATQVPKRGSLQLITEPPGARIFVDNADIGLSPLANDSIKEGSHKIRIELDGYDLVEFGITTSIGQTFSKRVLLRHSKAWKDSVESVRRAELKQAARDSTDQTTKQEQPTNSRIKKERPSQAGIRPKFIIWPAYTLSFGRITTHGATVQFGLKFPRNYLGVSVCYAGGSSSYLATDAMGNQLGTSTIQRKLFGGGLVWYFEGLNVKDIFIFAPGLTGGFWYINDAPLDAHYIQTYGPKVKLQVGPKKFYFVIESALLLSLSRMTPQVSAGVLFAL
jgi:TolB-like protein